MSTTHTPGPWQMEVVPGAFNIDGATHQVIAQSGADVGTVAICGWFANADADARLIAAAPELLVALQDMLKISQFLEPALEAMSLDQALELVRRKIAVQRQAEQAIAKATGEKT